MENRPPNQQSTVDLQFLQTISSQPKYHSLSRESLLALVTRRNCPPGLGTVVPLQQGREWLFKKGVNLEPLQQRAAQQREAPSQGPAPEKDYFHVDLSPATIQEYLDKEREYSLICRSQQAMTRPRRLKLLQQYLTLQLEETYPLWQRQDDPQLHNLYLQTVQRAVGEKKTGAEVAREILLALRHQDQSHPWNVLAYQLEAYLPNAPTNTNLTRLLTVSLKLLQQQLQQRLQGQELDRYVARHYLSKAEGRHPFEHGGFWAKVWLHYCLGHEKEVNDLLSSSQRDYRELGRLFIASEEALRAGKPIREHYNSRYEVEDVFYEQFVLTVTGQPRYSCQLFADPSSLELLLIVIRTLGVYVEDQTQFREVRKELLEHWQLAESPLAPMLYLLGYDHLVSHGCGGLLPPEDYLHFLIVLSGFPGLADPKELQTRLTQQLIQYILRLVSQGRREYVYYIPFLPPNALPHEVANITFAAAPIVSYPWCELQTLLPLQTYAQLLEHTLEAYSSQQKAHVLAARKARELAGDNPRALHYLVTLLSNHFLFKEAFSQQEVNEALELGLNWSQDDSTAPVYHYLFKFYQALKALLALISRRDKEGLRRFISECIYIEVELEHSSLNMRMIELLSGYGFLSVYFMFLRQVLKGMEIYCSGHETDKLELMRRVIREQIENLEQGQEMSINNKQHLKELKEEVLLTVF